MKQRTIGKFALAGGTALMICGAVLAQVSYSIWRSSQRTAESATAMASATAEQSAEALPGQDPPVPEEIFDFVAGMVTADAVIADDAAIVATAKAAKSSSVIAETGAIQSSLEAKQSQLGSAAPGTLSPSRRDVSVPPQPRLATARPADGAILAPPATRHSKPTLETAAMIGSRRPNATISGATVMSGSSRLVRNGRRESAAELVAVDQPRPAPAAGGFRVTRSGLLPGLLAGDVLVSRCGAERPEAASVVRQALLEARESGVPACLNVRQGGDLVSGMAVRVPPEARL